VSFFEDVVVLQLYEHSTKGDTQKLSKKRTHILTKDRTSRHYVACKRCLTKITKDKYEKYDLRKAIKTTKMGLQK